MSKHKITAGVVSQEMISDGIYSLWIEAAPIAADAVPGQFISLYCAEGTRLLPRPISLCEIDKENGRLHLVYRVAGKGTEEFSALKAGDTIEVLGPLGNGFPLTDKKAVLVGGGIGVPPMLQLAKSLDCEKVLVMGYRTADTYLEAELAARLRTFRHVDLAQIAGVIEDFYGIGVAFRSEALKNIQFTGTLDFNMPIDHILEVLTLSTNTRFNRNGEKITIHK